MKICPIFFISLPIRIEFGTPDNKNLVGCELRECWHSESHTLLTGVNEFLSELSTYTVRFDLSSVQETCT
jgi:hypothetical protein